ncbi:MAG: hypothetical protein K6G11_03485 [Lachnospiraceae bacterium]|nr:hypothetical protein [Lachnospiraceae bacterium]
MNEAKKYEYKTARLCGVMMLLLNVSVAAIGYLMIVKNLSYHYTKALAIFSAAYTFYYCITAVKNAISFRKSDSPILAASKKLNISGAALSIFVLQNTMFHTFGEQTVNTTHANFLTGTVISLIMLFNALSMIYGSHKNVIKQNEE